MRTYTLKLVVAAVMLILNQIFGIVSIYYLRQVDNNPFEAAAEVIKIDDRRIHLSDGRRVVISGGVDDFVREQIRESKNQIGLEAEGSDNHVTLFMKRPVFICGTGMPIIRLPFIPRDVPRYRQRMFATGKIEDRPTAR